MGRPILVIGGGIAGSAVAFALRRLGREVAVVEREPAGTPAAGRGRATGASAGMLAAQYETWEPSPVLGPAVESRGIQEEFLARIESLAGRPIGRGWEGALVPAHTPEEDRVARRAARWQTERGLHARILTGEEASSLQPGAAPEAISFLWLPDEGWVDTQALAAALPDALAAAGVDLVAGSPAERVVRRGGRVTGVRLRGGRTLDSDRVVVAAGAWSPELDGLPGTLPVRPVRGQMVRYGDVPGELRCIVAGHRGRYVVPRPDGRPVAGSTMERDSGFDPEPTEDGVAGIRLEAERLLPAAARGRVEETWGGLRPVSSDGKPILGPDPRVRGLFYATGYGRNGILLAPGAGRWVAAVVTGGAAGEEWGPFRPERFAATG